MDTQKIMQDILALRFQDAKKAYSLCLQLLDYTKSNPDSYLEVFAYTYIGDYYIGINDTKNALIYLSKAKNIVNQTNNENDILATIHSFLGIAHEINGDEQNAISNYLEGMSIAKDNKDVYLESINLNNLGVIFQRHTHYNKALEYFLKAYNLQKELGYFPSRSHLACNIGDLYLQINEKEKALQYYKECENTQDVPYLKDLYHRRNHCCYLAAIQEKDEAIYWAKSILDNQELLDNNRSFEAFEHYHMLCLAMLKVDEEETGLRFLELMEKACKGNVNQLQMIEQEKLRFILLFKGKKEYDKAFHRYYIKTQEFKDKVNEDIVKSMKDKIYLNELIIEKKSLEAQQRDLEKEANLDEVTGIYNRRYFEGLIQKYNEVTEKDYGVIMLDVDYFKEYNDTYGHGEGDIALHVVGDCLKINIQKGITPCRFGGDEFTCLCENISIEDMEAYIKNVRKELYDRFIKHEQSPCSDRLTLSIGYTHANNTRKSIYDLLTLADDALYESKSSGRNKYKKKV